MDRKKWLLSGIAAFVVLYIVSFLWYGLIMADAYGDWFSGAARAEVDFLYITLGYLFYGLTLAWVYPMGYKGGPGLQEGMRFGVIAGALIWLGPEFINLGSFDLTLTGTIVDFFYHLVEAMIGGMVIGLIHGSREAVAASGD